MQQRRNGQRSLADPGVLIASQRAGSRATAPAIPDFVPLPVPSGAAATRRFRRGQLITEAEAPATCLYLIRAGCVRTFSLQEDGEETTTGLLGPGQLVGLATLLGEPTYHTFALAQTPVDTHVLHAERLPEILAHNPELYSLIVTSLGQRLAALVAQLHDITLLTVPERVEKLRARLAWAFDGQPPHLTRETLAAAVAARRETVSRALHQERRSGRRRHALPAANANALHPTPPGSPSSPPSHWP